jgi:hypothetical protein
MKPNYLVEYFDVNNNSLECIMYDETEIIEYIADEEFQKLTNVGNLRLEASENWKQEYGIDYYIITKI